MTRVASFVLVAAALTLAAATAGCLGDRSEPAEDSWKDVEAALATAPVDPGSRRDVRAGSGEVELSLRGEHGIALFYVENFEVGSWEFGGVFPESSGLDSVFFVESMTGTSPPFMYWGDRELPNADLRVRFADVGLNSQEVFRRAMPAGTTDAVMEGNATGGGLVVFGFGLAAGVDGTARFSWRGDARVVSIVMALRPVLLDLDKLEGTSVVGRFGPTRVEGVLDATRPGVWEWTSLVVMFSGRMSLCLEGAAEMCVEQVNWSADVQLCGQVVWDDPTSVRVVMESDEGSGLLGLAVPYAPGTLPFRTNERPALECRGA